MAELDKIVDQLSKLTVVEAADLAKMLEKTWGVSASAPVAVAAPSSEDKDSKSASEEKLEYDVILESMGDKKINVIKEIKSIMGTGLKEAKDFVESAPKAVKTAIPKDEAEKIKSKLESAGAKVALK